VPGLRVSNTYLIVGEKNLTLVDSGLPGSSKKILEYVSSIGKKQEDLSLLLITHPDIDHCGGAEELKKKVPGLKIAIHEKEVQRLSGEKELREVKGAAKIAMSLMGVFVRFHPVSPDIALKDADVLDGLRTIFTPGHTEGSVCFYDEKDSAMFVGDTLRTSSKGGVELSSPSLSHDYDQMGESLKNELAPYEFEMLLPGHGPPILNGGSKKLGELIQRMERKAQPS